VLTGPRRLARVHGVRAVEYGSCLAVGSCDDWTDEMRAEVISNADEIEWAGVASNGRSDGIEGELRAVRELAWLRAEQILGRLV